MTAPDHLRVHRDRQHSSSDPLVEVLKFSRPDLPGHPRRPSRVQDAGGRRHELELDEVVEVPRHRQLDQVDGPAPAECLGRRNLVADATPVRLEVRAHEAALVLETVLEEERHGRGAVVPAGRAIPGRPHASHGLERLEAEFEHLALALRRELHGVLVHPAVMADLVASVANRADSVRVGARRVARDEERAGNPVALEQRENSADADRTELPARDHAW